MHIFAKFLMRLWMALSFLWTLACGAMLLFGGIDSEKEKCSFLGFGWSPLDSFGCARCC